tara:strand:+ start:142 stop:432 length:291 start_codon:yes stop_codon:yes gene_type:complete
MSHAPTEVKPWVLDGGAVDVPCDELLAYWREGDETSDVELTDGSVVISSRTPPPDAAAVKADILARVADGESTPVLASHLDAMGYRAALLAWAVRS